MKCFAYQIDIVVENSFKFYAVSFVKNKVCDGRTKAACTNKNSIYVAVWEQKMLNFAVQQIHTVTNTLLTKTAKAVEVLTHLAWCGTHNLSQLAGGYSCFTAGFKLCYITEVSWQSSDNR